MSDFFQNDPFDTKHHLNAVSPSFCLAKWYQVTIHLQNGHTHSCHHPPIHKIPVEELIGNPSAIHNTSHKKQRRKEMLKGVKHDECSYCWKAEAASTDNISDRYLKSSEYYTFPHMDETKTMPWDANVNPTYVEVSFGNVCNFKCSYCAPHISSKWMEEIKQHGPYPTGGKFNDLAEIERLGQMPIPEREENPYVEAFWKWWPELYKNLKVFRITGGEPLLNKNTFRILEYIRDHPEPNRNLALAINSNLGVPDELYNRFLNLIAEIKDRISDFTIYTSADAYGERANYIRHGMDYNKWIENMHKYFRTIPDSGLRVMCAFNALSVTSYLQLYKDVLDFRDEYQRENSEYKNRIVIDSPYLTHPQHQAVTILPDEYILIMQETNKFIDRNPRALKIEKVKFSRIVSIMEKNPRNAKNLPHLRSDFYRMFTEHDRRRHTDFLATFPEMEEFWNLCKQESDRI